MIIINEINFGATKLNWAKTEKYPNSTMTYDQSRVRILKL